MRAYIFGNFYLSSIQQGIQAAHVVTDMFVKYKKNNKKRKMLHDWANKHKTMVLLNGGTSEDLRSVLAFFDSKKNSYPWIEFYEDMNSLDEAFTSVGIILPERIYEAARIVREDRRIKESFEEEGVLHIMVDKKMDWFHYDWWEKDLIERINSCPLAR